MKAPLLFLVALLLVSSASALSCVVDTSPFVRLTSPPSAFCTVAEENSTSCFTFLSNPANETTVWGVYPDTMAIKGYGKAYAYLVINDAVTVEFSTDRLYANQTVTGNVQCGMELFSFNFTPQYIDYDLAPQGLVWSVQNTPFIIAFFLLLFALMLYVVILWRARR